MRVTSIIQKNDEAWQEVFLSWKDDFSQRFYNSVVMELKTALASFDAACVILEEKTDEVRNKLRAYENL
jgi:hypothetical protein